MSKAEIMNAIFERLDASNFSYEQVDELKAILRLLWQMIDPSEAPSSDEIEL